MMKFLFVVLFLRLVLLLLISGAMGVDLSRSCRGSEPDVSRTVVCLWSLVFTLLYVCRFCHMLVVCSLLYVCKVTDSMVAKSI